MITVWPKAGAAITATRAYTATGFTGAVSYVASPALPAGLTLNPTTGVISGAPAAVQAATAYTITATGATAGTATATAGWTAIPDDITDVALTAATRAWFARQSGQQDIVGSDENGAPLVSRFFSARDLGTLRAYALVDGLA